MAWNPLTLRKYWEHIELTLHVRPTPSQYGLVNCRQVKQAYDESLERSIQSALR